MRRYRPVAFEFRKQPYANTRCQYCGASDAFDAAHARGCPTLPEPSKKDLLRLARACEDGWSEKKGRMTRFGEKAG